MNGQVWMGGGRKEGWLDTRLPPHTPSCPGALHLTKGPPSEGEPGGKLPAPSRPDASATATATPHFTRKRRSGAFSARVSGGTRSGTLHFSERSPHPVTAPSWKREGPSWTAAPCRVAAHRTGAITRDAAKASLGGGGVKEPLGSPPPSCRPLAQQQRPERTEGLSSSQQDWLGPREGQCRST